MCVCMWVKGPYIEGALQGTLHTQRALHTYLHTHAHILVLFSTDVGVLHKVSRGFVHTFGAS